MEAINMKRTDSRPTANLLPKSQTTKTGFSDWRKRTTRGLMTDALGFTLVEMVPGCEPYPEQGSLIEADSSSDLFTQTHHRFQTRVHHSVFFHMCMCGWFFASTHLCPSWFQAHFHLQEEKTHKIAVNNKKIKEVSHFDYVFKTV